MRQDSLHALADLLEHDLSSSPKAKRLAKALLEELRRERLPATVEGLRMQAEDVGAAASRFLTIEQVLEIDPPQYLVDQMLPRSGIAVLRGRPGIGKSFVALDLALSIAYGVNFLGRSTQRASVVYVAAEGSTGYRPRVSAWLRAHPQRKLTRRFLFYPRPVNLADREAVDTFLGAIPRKKIGLIVLDTFPRCMPGLEENSARDMGIAIDAMDWMQLRTGATVLGVHHTGKRGDSARGSTALEGAADTMLLLKRSKDKRGLTLTVDKQKDSDELCPIGIRLAREAGSLVPRLDTTARAETDQDEDTRETQRERAEMALLRVLADVAPATNAQWKRAAREHGVGASFDKRRESLVNSGLAVSDSPPKTRGAKYVPSDRGTARVAESKRSIEVSLPTNTLAVADQDE